MYEVPRIYGAFDVLFKLLGTKEKAEYDDYLVLLEELTVEMNGNPLNINELSAVVKMLELISAEIRAKNQRIVSTLYVPDAHTVLMSRNDVVYNDSPWLAARITKVDNISIHFINPKISIQLAKSLHLTALSSLVDEVLVPFQTSAA